MHEHDRKPIESEKKRKWVQGEWRKFGQSQKGSRSRANNLYTFWSEWTEEIIDKCFAKNKKDTKLMSRMHFDIISHNLHDAPYSTVYTTFQNDFFLKKWNSKLEKSTQFYKKTKKLLNFFFWSACPPVVTTGVEGEVAISFSPTGGSAAEMGRRKPFRL